MMLTGTYDSVTHTVAIYIGKQYVATVPAPGHRSADELQGSGEDAAWIEAQICEEAVAEALRKMLHSAGADTTTDR